jgi:hypothetical protein
MAATRRGCVQQIMPLLQYPSSYRNWPSWVVFPDPVSPMTMSTVSNQPLKPNGRPGKKYLDDLEYGPSTLLERRRRVNTLVAVSTSEFGQTPIDLLISLNASRIAILICSCHRRPFVPLKRVSLHAVFKCGQLTFTQVRLIFDACQVPERGAGDGCRFRSSLHYISRMTFYRDRKSHPLSFLSLSAFPN